MDRPSAEFEHRLERWFNAPLTLTPITIWWRSPCRYLAYPSASWSGCLAMKLSWHGRTAWIAVIILFLSPSASSAPSHHHSLLMVSYLAVGSLASHGQ